jgi:hypothetical protein
VPTLRGNQSQVEAAYDRKIARLAQRIADLLEVNAPIGNIWRGA